MKVYIAFSIHGTNAFITATRDDGIDMGYGLGCRVGGFLYFSITSRRQDYSRAKDGVKLRHIKLLKRDGSPICCPIRVLSVFNKLAAEGWTVDKSAFLRRHQARFFRKG